MVAPLLITTPDPEKFGAALAATVTDDGDTIREISFDMLDVIEQRLAAGSFSRPPLKEETLEKKRRKGWPLTPMTATGALRRNLRRKFSRKSHSATVKRGKREEYGFYQQYGSGRNEKTEWMFLDEGDRGEILSTYTDGLEKRLGELDGRSFD